MCSIFSACFRAGRYVDSYVILYMLKSVYSAVRTGSLNKAVGSSSLKRVPLDRRTLDLSV